MHPCCVSIYQMMTDGSRADRYISCLDSALCQVNGLSTVSYRTADKDAMPCSRSNGSLEAMGICLAAVQVLIQNGSAPQPGCIFNVSVSNKRLSQINSPWRARQGAATCSSSFHMSNDRRYSAQDAIAWEAYDDATIAFVKGEKGHPGPAPPGYKESYMLRHPKAPLPVSVGRAPQLRIIPMLKTAQLRCSNQIIMACACRTTRSVPSFITTRWSTISSGK